MAARFSFYYAAIFLAVGINLPFWPAWLKHRGLDAAEISLILSVGTWIRALANPLIAHFADRSGAHRKIILVSAGGGVIAYALFGLADGFWPLFAISILASAMFMSLIPLGENLASRASVEYRFDYGRVRLWGSMTFILAAYAAGWVIERTGDAAILWMMICALAAAFAAGFTLPRPKPRERGPVRFPALALLRRPDFLVFIAAVSLLQSSHATVYLFGTIHWRNTGLSDEVIGALWAEGVIAEIILFAFSGAVVARFGPTRLMLFAAAAGIVRWTVLANTTEIAALVAVQWLHAFTFGAAHLAAMHYILRTIPEQMSATAQALYSGLATGVIMGVTMLVAGRLFERIGGEAFYAMIALSVAGGIAAVALSRFGPGRDPAA